MHDYYVTATRCAATAAWLLSAALLAAAVIAVLNPWQPWFLVLGLATGVTVSVAVTLQVRYYMERMATLVREATGFELEERAPLRSLS